MLKSNELEFFDYQNYSTKNEASMSGSSISTSGAIRDPIGQSPVPIPVLLLGKAAMFCCWAFAIVKILKPESMLYDGIITQSAGIVLFVAGLFMAGASIVHLGKSISVGIPRTKTELKTNGFYRFTRNPIYLGAFFMCAGSCLFAIHPVNFLLFAIAISIHHEIVKKEEQFLERTFGEQWTDYSRRVRRYIGRFGGHSST
jgi:protein-S-isoprenylcysteine O-methyltransferase Ste14